MPNKNYLRGRRLEYTRKKYWEDFGYVVLRTAGSHGPFDLIIIVPGGPVTLLQLKRCKTLSAAKRLIEEFESNPPLPLGPYAQVMECHVDRQGMVAAVIERIRS